MIHFATGNPQSDSAAPPEEDQSYCTSALHDRWPGTTTILSLSYSHTRPWDTNPRITSHHTSEGVSNFADVGMLYKPTVHEFQIISITLSLNNLWIRQSVSPHSSKEFYAERRLPFVHWRALSLSLNSLSTGFSLHTTPSSLSSHTGRSLILSRQL